MSTLGVLPVLKAPVVANVPATQEPIPKLLKELWDNRSKPDVYNKLLESLHTRREEFLKSLCRFKFDPKALLQILVDYRQRYGVKNFSDKASCLIQSARTCFNGANFELSWMEEVGHHAFQVDQDYPPAVFLSIPYCQGKRDILQTLDDLRFGVIGDSVVGTKILKKIAAKHWFNSPEIARAFLKVLITGNVEPSSKLSNTIKKAVLLLIPKDSEPTSKYDSDHYLVIQTMRRVLTIPSNVALIKSLVRERPKWADYLCRELRTSLNKKPNEICW